jgi:hypothetical protein
MAPKDPEPTLGVDDRVYEVVTRFDADGRRILGTVVKVYALGGFYRYVVKFDDGTEGVFFDFEIRAT